MADRRSFLGAVSGAAASVLLAGPADAQTPVPAAATTGPSPKPSASPKPPTALAAAIAASMRAFDPALSDAELDTIARGIDDNRRGAARLNPHRATALRNGDEPVTRFSVRGER
jgi:hypothetical protein